MSHIFLDFHQVLLRDLILKILRKKTWRSIKFSRRKDIKFVRIRLLILYLRYFFYLIFYHFSPHQLFIV